MDPSVPPPLPSSAKKKNRGLRIVIITAACIVGGVFAIFAAGAVYWFTARDFTPTESQKTCVLTIHDMEELFEIDIKPGAESWTCTQYFDRSKEIYYLYEDIDGENIQLDCTLTIERKRSDALASYAMEWQGLKFGNRISEDSITLEHHDALFRWGERSQFAYQSIDGERYGFAFIARKGNRIYFVDCWGLVVDEPSEIADLLNPHLERFGKERF